jgi:hypothetical protein
MAKSHYKGGKDKKKAREISYLETKLLIFISAGRGGQQELDRHGQHVHQVAQQPVASHAG